MKNFLKKILFVTLVTHSLFWGGCTITRQLSAAEIIKKTGIELEYMALDSIMVYPNLFPKSEGFLPDPQVILFVKNLTQGVIEKDVGCIFITASVRASNTHEKSLSLRSLKAVLKLDTIATLPVDLKDTMILVSGNSRIALNTIIPIDQSLFHLMEMDTLHFVGKLEVSLEGDSEIVPLEFSIKQYISPEQKQNLKDQAIKQTIDFVVERWLGKKNK